MPTSESFVGSGNRVCGGRSGATGVFARFTEGQLKVPSIHKSAAVLERASGSGAMVIPGEALGAVVTIIE